MGDWLDSQALSDLSKPAAYPTDASAKHGIEWVQTHISHVFLSQSRVYKLRKPVDLGFVQFATRDERTADCEREVALNRRLAADVYLGDVSSQIYEFLLRPRPCLFIDAHRQAWQDDPNFLWKAGPVVANVDDLGGKLSEAIETHEPQYASAQREMFAYSIDLSDRPSAERAAEAVLSFLDGAIVGS